MGGSMVLVDEQAELRRKWTRHADAWRLRLPWLTAKKHNDGTIGLGCAFCSNAPTSGTSFKNPWVTCRVGLSSAQPSNMQWHAQSATHNQISNTLNLDCTAPPVTQLAEAVEAVWKGQACLDSAGPFKFRNLIWSVAEVRLEIFLQF